ncbi:MAG: DUF2326 domain-containing protein [Oscillospiraceae bacterium]|nr:DUF2326 domain-containing protein [Oscillospiraceae bacterium]
MLCEIICDHFKQPRIQFYPGLNTVLGDGSGSNSIGKSTFLMIIDFVFGGNDYVNKSTDVQRNIGNHTIKFCFHFNGDDFFFSRDTHDPEIVYSCNEKYEKVKPQTLTEYCNFLKEKYLINLPDLSFRSIVGRYIRVYGRDNINERRPLNLLPNEPSGTPAIALLKLFNLYSAIAELEATAHTKKEALQAFRKAQKLSFIPKIGVRQYKQNTKHLEDLQTQEAQLAADLGSGLLDMDSTLTDEVISIKKELSILRRQRSRIQSQLFSIEQSTSHENPSIHQDFSDLLEFFPQAEIRHLTEIEQFHAEITQILCNELDNECARLNALLAQVSADINELKLRLQNISTENYSRIVLEKHSALIKEINRLSQENARFDEETELVTAEKNASERARTMRNEQLIHLQNTINLRMAEINDYLYSGKKASPTLTFNDLQYTFQTRDDTGTGTSYKGLVVFDLSVLELTQLPIVVHDSVVLKQIADEAIETILMKYQSVGKQVFISLDKAPSYTGPATEILKKTTVLSLSKDGNELFGRSWNEKS